MIHAAGAPGGGTSARPKALVVLVNTKRPTPAATASSSRVSVPVTFVSTKAWRECEPTCGLCSVAACTTASAPASERRTSARSATEPDHAGGRGGEHVETEDVVAARAQDAHERVAEMPGAARDEDPHGAEPTSAWMVGAPAARVRRASSAFTRRGHSGPP